MGSEELHCVRIISCERKGAQKRVSTPAGLLWLPCMAWVVLWERDGVRYRWEDANGDVERDGLLMPGYRTLDLSSPEALEESAGRLSTSIEEEIRKASKKYCRKVFEEGTIGVWNNRTKAGGEDVRGRQRTTTPESRR